MNFTNKIKSLRLRRFATAGIVTLLMIGCSEQDSVVNTAGSGTGSGTTDQSTDQPVGAIVTISSHLDDLGDSTIATSGDVTVTSARIVIGRIRFIGVDGNESIEFRTDNPTLLDLDLSGSTHSLGSMAIPSGTYDETRFRIEKLQDIDSVQFEDNADMQDLSIRVEGYFGDDPADVFVWTARFMEDQVHKLIEPFTVADGDTVSMVFEFDNTDWFSDADGETLDPREVDSDGSIQSQIEHNVKAAFKAIAE